jgi:hypothetical protein
MKGGAKNFLYGFAPYPAKPLLKKWLGSPKTFLTASPLTDEVLRKILATAPAVRQAIKIPP